MDAHPHRGERGIRFDLVDQPEAELDRGPRLRAAEHHRIPERLHLLRPVARGNLAGAALELDRDPCSPIVALAVGQGGEADQVGEKKCVS
jgi:hypothetical protein